MSDFKNSIAQKNVQFPIETVIEPLAGENYSRAMIFVPLSLAGTVLPGIEDPVTKTVISLTASNYGDLTGGLLKTWLTPFFKSAQAATCGIALFDDGDEAVNTLAVCYEATKMYAYFKFMLASTEKYNELNVTLTTLCLPDPLYSDHWIGTSDTNCLSKSSALIEALTTAKSNARVVYNPDATINAALAQLGRTLSVANATGTPVGNSSDMVSFTGIGPSGSNDAEGNPTNLTSVEAAALDDQRIGYNTYVDGTTDEVVTEGSLTLQGESVGANWVKNFISYMCKVRTARLITTMNKFRNNATYQGILLILEDEVAPFVQMGRLANFLITAPVFSDLPKSGDAITVANAWKADFIDNTRSVTVYGTLYLTQPTR